MKRTHLSHASRRSGVILLVVLGALTFFSVLVATYLVFANDSRDASVALARQSTRAPDVNWMMNEALMTLVRGTSDPNNPFFGEDLLSDYYGRDGEDMQVHHVDNFPSGPQYLGSGLVRFPFSREVAGATPPRDPALLSINDVYAGRILTFTDGPLRNNTYVVLRSLYVAATGMVPEHDNVFIQLKESDVGSVNPTANAIRSLFYDDPADLTTGGFTIRMNGSPRNSRGIGYDFTSDNVDQTTSTTAQYRMRLDPTQPVGPMNPPVGFDLPVALQPNHLGREVDKSVLTGDFDEDYDAPDFNNWFLSHRRADGSVIPSFHRPAVLNYILNETDWSAATPNDAYNLMASLSRGTFRPFPLARGQLGVVPGPPPMPSPAINERFTGGSNEFALRTSLRVVNGGMVNTALLNQLARALIDGTYDVDNDADGFADSIWIDLGLPVFTSREGKLLRPMVAPMIEDLSARLNLNAHSNNQLVQIPVTAGLRSNQAFWAGLPFNATPNNEFAFQGLGWGPAEIGLGLSTSDNSSIPAAVQTEIQTWVNQRYRFGEQQLATPDVPGRGGRDPLDVIWFGYRPPIHQAAAGFGRSTDPFGRGGVAMGRAGDLVASISGTNISNAPVVNEAVNNPYESDPTGELGGDRAALLSDLEVILRSNDFDSELLPQPLRERLQQLFRYPTSPLSPPTYGSEVFGEFTRSYTTLSVSDDTPTSMSVDGDTPHLSLVDLIDRILVANGGTSGSYSQVQWNRLLPPELRLGRKMDVNRPIGNRLDDNGNNVIDEPLEVTRRYDGMDNDGDGFTDEGDELTGEVNAFGVFAPTVGNVPPDYVNQRPNYTFDDELPTAPPVGPGEQRIAVSGRQLLARHLYILMMALSRDLDTPANETDFISISGDPPLAGSGYDADLYKARRLAQWAVNVVDYSDPDSIMTRFVFDPTPFDASGWSPPLDTGGTQFPNGLHQLGGTPATDDFVVWGVEAPELVLSESMAYHDVRLRDTNRDNNEQETKGGGPMDDNDSDQVRRPEGSLLLELYCPHPVIAGDQTTQPAAPQELYNTVAATGASELDLARVAPPFPGDNLGAPVWRIAISERHDVASADPTLDPNQAKTLKPDTYSFQPDYPDEIEPAPPANPTLQYDRFILFVDTPTTPINDPNVGNVLNEINEYVGRVPDMDPNEVFYAPNIAGANTDRALDPGQFLVLSPGVQRRFGSKEDAMAPGGVLPSDQRFQIEADGLIQYNHASNRVSPNFTAANPPFTPALPMLIAAPRPQTWGAANPSLPNNIVGINVSEPLPNGGGGYYPQPTLQYDGGTPDYPLYDAYVDLTDVANSAVDAPMDTDPNLGFGRIPDESPNDAMVNEPVLGTISNYCSAFLQRLADPTRPFHEELNPYRTVDWITIDLSVYSGEDRPINIMADPMAATYTRRSRQRNGRITTIGGATTAANALFSYQTDFDDAENRQLDPGAADYFQFATLPGDDPMLGTTVTHINSSFNFLNTAWTSVNPMFPGFDPSIGMSGGNATGNDRNLPQFPYARHPWLNRPFASHFELMMVPACSQGRLFEEFSFDPGAETAIYPLRTAAGIDDPAVFYAPYRHLLNFFHSNVDDGSASPTGAEFVKLFDYVHTLPRFRGEVESINPRRLTSGNAAQNAQLNLIRPLLSPPFNFRYDNQRQARVNLNTLAEFPVWAGLMKGHLNQEEFDSRSGTGGENQLSYNRFIDNRRGFDIPNPVPAPSFVTGAQPYNYDPANLDPRFPTEFVGIYRSATTTPKAVDLRTAADRDLIRRRPVNGTLLRGAGNLDISDPVGGTPSTVSMLVRAGAGSPDTNFQSQRPFTTMDRQHDRYRNAYMRYQTLMRMPNLAADNSQVFVIRLTLGFFEVDPATQNLKDEYNADIGQNQRYQATFVVDRSLPVGFEAGNDLNARDIVIFESYEQ